MSTDRKTNPTGGDGDGKAARRVVPRTAHAELQTFSRDPLQILTAQDRSRVPELVPFRYGRMLASPFAFFRGAAAVMAADLARTPTTDFSVQLCGDAHLSNFGVFSAPDRRLVFDCNDFDETCRGPFEWDVKRLGASIAIAGRERGLGGKERRRAVRRAASSYRRSMRGFAAMGNIEVWYSRLDVEPALSSLRFQVDGRRYRQIERSIAKARGKDSLRALVHAARKVVGVGSVGTRAWIVLLLGRDGKDPLFLQAKEARASVLEPYLGESPYDNHGRRVVEGQRLMQAAGDIFLGWVRAKGEGDEERCFYVRQLWDGKGSADVERMSPRDLVIYGSLCGEALARAHARSGDRIAIASYLGRGEAFDKALASFAEAYADQNEKDFARVADAAQNGEIAVEAQPS